MTEVAPSEPAGADQPTLSRAMKRRLTVEVWIVLGLSLGQSGVYAVLQWAVLEWNQWVQGQPLADTSTQLNPSRSSQPYLDLIYQLLAIFFALMPVFLALYLLSAHGKSALRRIGFDVARPLRDLGTGVLLAASIGIPGIAFYILARTLGINVQVVAEGISGYWWAIPILILSAAQNAVLEEVIVVGYLTERLTDLGWKPTARVAASALLRGSYHFYQGLGGFVGNVVMGVVFALYYRWKKRVMPLVVAHTVMDIVAFVGYALLPDSIKQALHL